jgi:hypothetical protein
MSGRSRTLSKKLSDNHSDFRGGLFVAGKG